jgi:hypothetical protein
MKSYWKYIGALWTGCVSLLVFELSQRGIQMNNPFFDLWDYHSGSKLALSMLILACGSGLFYFGLLFFLIVQVFVNFHRRKSQLPGMNRMRRAFYEVKFKYRKYFKKLLKMSVYHTK